MYILILSGVAKLLFSMQEDKFLTAVHPLFAPLTNRQIFGFVGFLELFLAFVIYFETRRLLKILVILWISTVFVCYRGVMHFIGYKGPCGCLGNLKELINISDYIAIILLAFMLIGGFISLYYTLKNNYEYRQGLY